MNVMTKKLAVELFGASLGCGVLGLGYSTYYKLDKRIVIPFFIIGLILARVGAEFSIVEANKNLGGREFKELPRKDSLKHARIHSLNMLVQTSVLTIALISGRQLGIFGSKATIFISIAVISLLATCPFAFLGAKAQPENPEELKNA
jgi:hypothetical protein